MTEFSYNRYEEMVADFENNGYKCGKFIDFEGNHVCFVNGKGITACFAWIKNKDEFGQERIFKMADCLVADNEKSFENWGVCLMSLPLPADHNYIFECLEKVASKEGKKASNSYKSLEGVPYIETEYKQKI